MKFKVFDFMRITCLLLFLIVGIFNLSSCTETTSDNLVEQINIEKEDIEINVFAAASLTDSLEEIKNLYEKENENIKIILNFASSGALQKQIQQGAPADIFFSASIGKMDKVVETGEINREDIIHVLKNSIVVICPDELKDKPESLSDLEKSKFLKVSIAAPESAPAGRYAMESLENSNVYENIKDKIVYGKNVRQTLMYVETGEVEAGIVYSSDAVVMKNGYIAFEVPDNMHSEIIYPSAVLKESNNRIEAQNLLNYINDEKSLNIFVKNGFKVVEE